MAQKVQIVINGVNKAGGALKEVARQLGEAEGAAGKLDAALRGMGKIALGGMLAALGSGLTALVKGTKVAANLETVTTQFEVLTGSAKTAKDTIEGLRNFAKTTPLSFDAITEGAKNLMAFGVSAEDVQGKLVMLGNAAMGDNEKMLDLVGAFGKIRARGKSTMRELNQFTQAGVPIIQALADSMHATTEEILSMSQAGKIGYADVNKALVQLTTNGGKFDGMMQRMNKTFSGQLQVFHDTIEHALGNFGTKILPDVKQGLDDIAHAVDATLSSDGFAKFVGTITRLFGWISRQIPDLIVDLEFFAQAAQFTVATILMALGDLSESNPVIRFLFEPVGEMYEALKKGFTEGDWSDVFGATIDLAKPMLTILATVQLAKLGIAALESALSTQILSGSKFLHAAGLPGFIAMATIGIGIADAVQSGDYDELAGKIFSGLTAGLAAYGITHSMQAGLLVFSVGFSLNPLGKLRDKVKDLVGNTDTGEMPTFKSSNPPAGSYQGIIDKYTNYYNPPISNEEARKQLEKLGIDTTQGFELGLGDWSKTGQQRWNEFESGARKAADSHSPARTMIKFGEDIVAGLAIGTEGMEELGKGDIGAYLAYWKQGMARLKEWRQDARKANDVDTEKDKNYILGTGTDSDASATTDKSANFWQPMFESMVSAVMGKLNPDTGRYEGGSEMGQMIQGGLSGGGSGVLSSIVSIVSKLGGQFMGLITSISSVKSIMSPWLTIMQAFFDTVKPMVDDVLSPLIGILKTIGNTAGKLLAPAFKLLGTLTKAVGDAFAWLYNKVIVPIGNMVLKIGVVTSNWVIDLINAVISALNKLPFVNIKKLKRLDYDSMKLNEISGEDVYAAGSSGSTGSSSGTSSSSSSATNYTIYVYQTFEGNVIGDGGMVAVGRYCASAIQSYLGAGGRVAFLEA